MFGVFRLKFFLILKNSQGKNIYKKICFGLQSIHASNLNYKFQNVGYMYVGRSLQRYLIFLLQAFCQLAGRLLMNLLRCARLQDYAFFNNGNTIGKLGHHMIIVRYMKNTLPVCMNLM